MIIALLPGAGLAQESAPKIDGAKYCQAIAGMYTSATQSFLRDACLKTEADSARKLARVWQKVPAKDRESCQSLLAVAQPSNQQLAGCIALAMAQHFLEGDLPDCR
jgi:hypothetical protein